MKIEVSNGEIVDKLTILELKRQNAQTQEQARHREEELNYLQPIVESMDIPTDILTQLREVNKKLKRDYPADFPPSPNANYTGEGLSDTDIDCTVCPE